MMGVGCWMLGVNGLFSWVLGVECWVLMNCINGSTVVNVGLSIDTNLR